MKSITIIFLCILSVFIGTSFTGGGSSQSNQSNNPVAKASENPVVYYFHNTRRCAICNAVENESKKALQELYGDKVPFLAYNIEETEGREKAGEIGVFGQALLIVSRDTTVNITVEGFMYARTDPDRFKQIIKESTDPLL